MQRSSPHFPAVDNLPYCDFIQLLEDDPGLFQHVQLRIYDLPGEDTPYHERASRINKLISSYQTSHPDHLFQVAAQVSLPPRYSTENVLTELAKQEDNGLEFPVLLDSTANYFDSRGVLSLQNHRTSFGMITTKSKRGFQFEL